MKVKDISIIALFCAISIIFSFFNIILPFSPIVFSMSVFGVFLSGALLKPKQAVLSQVVYILLGIIGLPVFSGFKGGLGHLLGPTGGYIISYPIMAFIISFINKRIKSHKFFTLFISMILALCICYTMGSGWLSVVLKISFLKAILIGAAPFAVFDIIKALICSTLSVYLLKVLVKSRLLDT